MCDKEAHDYYWAREREWEEAKKKTVKEQLSDRRC